MLPPTLAALAARQAGVFTADQAREHGLVVAPLVRTGRLVVVRRHVYACRQTLAALCPPERAAAHASARLLVTRGDLVASHATAAAIHGYALLSTPAEPQLTEARRTAAMARRRGIALSALPGAHRCECLGVRVTSPARTVADCARTMPAAAAVVTADSALRCGVPRADVLQLLAWSRHWPGVRQGLEVVRFADARADSPLESATRWLLARQGLPAPDLQITICEPDGRDVADVDFVWLAQRTVLETDGRLKYDSADALWREKRREDALRQLGFEVVRGVWSDLQDGCRDLAARVRGGFALNAARVGLPDYSYRDKPDRRRQRLS